jgi:hypothetical protein
MEMLKEKAQEANNSGRNRRRGLFIPQEDINTNIYSKIFLINFLDKISEEVDKLVDADN